MHMGVPVTRGHRSLSLRDHRSAARQAGAAESEQERSDGAKQYALQPPLVARVSGRGVCALRASADYATRAGHGVTDSMSCSSRAELILYQTQLCAGEYDEINEACCVWI